MAKKTIVNYKYSRNGSDYYALRGKQDTGGEYANEELDFHYGVNKWREAKGYNRGVKLPKTKIGK